MFQERKTWSTLLNAFQKQDKDTQMTMEFGSMKSLAILKNGEEE